MYKDYKIVFDVIVSYNQAEANNLGINQYLFDQLLQDGEVLE